MILVTPIKRKERGKKVGERQQLNVQKSITERKQSCIKSLYLWSQIESINDKKHRQRNKDRNILFKSVIDTYKRFQLFSAIKEIIFSKYKYTTKNRKRKKVLINIRDRKDTNLIFIR